MDVDSDMVPSRGIEGHTRATLGYISYMRAILGGSWDLVTSSSWACNPTVVREDTMVSRLSLTLMIYSIV